MDESCDGAGLLWHRSPEAWARHRADNSSQAVMEADEALTFAEPVYNFSLLAEESTLLHGIGGPVKLFRFIERASSLTRQEFESAWKGQYAKAVLGSSVVNSNVCRYVQNHALSPERPGGWGLKFDCVGEYWFATPGDVRSAFEYVAALCDVERGLLKRSIWVSSNEVVLHDVPEAPNGNG